MSTTRLAILAALAATPAAAAAEGKPFLSLANTDFVVLLAFLLFVGILVYFKVPTMLTGMLDKRAEGIRSDIDEARALREEAQSLLAKFERQQADAEEQAERIRTQAREEAKRDREQAKTDIAETIERRLEAAEEQLASAEAQAMKNVRDRAINVAVAAAAEAIRKGISDEEANRLLDESIDSVDKHLD